MLTETGRVIAIDDDGVWVETLKQSACHQCKARKGCGQKLLASTFANTSKLKVYFRSPTSFSQQGADTEHFPPSNVGVENVVAEEFGARSPDMYSLSTGDSVLIGVDERTMLLGVFRAYLLPLLVMLLSIFLAARLDLGEVGITLSAALGLFFGALAARRMAFGGCRGQEVQLLQKL